MVLVFTKMTSSTPARGMSYTVKLGCQAYLGFSGEVMTTVNPRREGKVELF